METSTLVHAKPRWCSTGSRYKSNLTVSPWSTNAVFDQLADSADTRLFEATAALGLEKLLLTWRKLQHSLFVGDSVERTLKKMRDQNLWPSGTSADPSLNKLNNDLREQLLVMKMTVEPEWRVQAERALAEYREFSLTEAERRRQSSSPEEEDRAGGAGHKHTVFVDKYSMHHAWGVYTYRHAEIGVFGDNDNLQVANVQLAGGLGFDDKVFLTEFGLVAQELAGCEGVFAAATTQPSGLKMPVPFRPGNDAKEVLDAPFPFESAEVEESIRSPPSRDMDPGYFTPGSSSPYPVPHSGSTPQPSGLKMPAPFRPGRSDDPSGSSSSPPPYPLPTPIPHSRSPSPACEGWGSVPSHSPSPACEAVQPSRSPPSTRASPDGCRASPDGSADTFSRLVDPVLRRQATRALFMRDLLLEEKDLAVIVGPWNVDLNNFFPNSNLAEIFDQLTEAMGYIRSNSLGVDDEGDSIGDEGEIEIMEEFLNTMWLPKEQNDGGAAALGGEAFVQMSNFSETVEGGLFDALERVARAYQQEEKYHHLRQTLKEVLERDWKSQEVRTQLQPNLWKEFQARRNWLGRKSFTEEGLQVAEIHFWRAYAKWQLEPFLRLAWDNSALLEDDEFEYGKWSLLEMPPSNDASSAPAYIFFDRTKLKPADKTAALHKTGTTPHAAVLGLFEVLQPQRDGGTVDGRFIHRMAWDARATDFAAAVTPLTDVLFRWFGTVMPVLHNLATSTINTIESQKQQVVGKQQQLAGVFQQMADKNQHELFAQKSAELAGEYHGLDKQRLDLQNRWGEVFARLTANWQIFQGVKALGPDAELPGEFLQKAMVGRRDLHTLWGKRKGDFAAINGRLGVGRGEKRGRWVYHYTNKETAEKLDPGNRGEDKVGGKLDPGTRGEDKVLLGLPAFWGGREQFFPRDHLFWQKNRKTDHTCDTVFRRPGSRFFYSLPSSTKTTNTKKTGSSQCQYPEDHLSLSAKNNFAIGSSQCQYYPEDHT